MGIQKQVAVSLETFQTLDALALLTERTKGALVTEGIQALLDKDPGLRGRVEAVEAAKGEKK